MISLPPISIAMPDGTAVTVDDFAECRVTYHARPIPGGLEVSCHGLRSIAVALGGARLRDPANAAAAALFAEIRRRFEDAARVAAKDYMEDHV